MFLELKNKLSRFSWVSPSILHRISLKMYSSKRADSEPSTEITSRKRVSHIRIMSLIASRVGKV